jgi:hypothetical protein
MVERLIEIIKHGIIVMSTFLKNVRRFICLGVVWIKVWNTSKYQVLSIHVDHWTYPKIKG